MLNHRYSQTIWSGIKNDITIVGLGTIGRNAAEHLFLLGHKLNIYEDDCVEIHNCIPQGFSIYEIGKPKTSAFGRQMHGILGKGFKAEDLNVFPQKFVKGDFVTPITIAAVDNMSARKDIYETWLQQEDRLLFIDGRMMAESFDVIVATKEDDSYMLTWFSQDQAADGFCSNRATRHCGQMIGSWICQLICNFNSGLLPTNVNYEGQFQEINY